MRLREMIKLIREAKTAADERDIVAKECADIRTSFKKEENDLRARNICKLIYVNLLGYATHFAQMDCLKLIVSNSYSDKRVGYLGLMMLLDERQEVLMLVTNSLKKYVMLHAGHGSAKSANVFGTRPGKDEFLTFWASTC
jgi:AP-1 complex subunit gamma-1